ncbi:MAG: DnaK suppressor protein [Alteromonadaceae bacterium]|jgi:DnaK suppressor protein
MLMNNILITLEEKKTQLVTRIDAIERDFKKGRSPDFTEHMTESENDEVLKGICQEAQAELRQVNAALISIENGEYGHCVQCAEKIAVGRLKALPYTNTCINCAQ